jgi:hypothetical protein
VRKRRLLTVLAAFGLSMLVSRRLEEEGVKLEGSFLGAPYDFRPPTLDRFRERCWNPDDPRLFTPHVFGWGWAVNFHALGRMLGWLPSSERGNDELSAGD